MLVRCIPIVFAFLWSTGFIGAKYGLPYIGPFSFLALRFLVVLVFLSAIIAIVKPSFPKGKKAYTDVFIAGVLIHGIYLGGVFLSIKLGLPAGITAVIIGVQPILTVLLMDRLKSPLAVAVSAIGFMGLLLVIFDGNSVSAGTELNSTELNMTAISYLPAIVSLFGITLGTIYQKKFCSDVHILSSAFLQYIPTFFIFVMLFAFFEINQVSAIVWHPQLFFALLWLVVVLSIGAVLLMNMLYQFSSANTAASYFYLSPPLALLLAYFLFDETITLINFLGIVLIVMSVYMTAKLQKISTR